jgi:tetratricopeptide (TPR) repeat protein
MPIPFLSGLKTKIKQKFRKLSLNSVLYEINKINVAELSQEQARDMLPRLEKLLRIIRHWWKYWPSEEIAEYKKMMVVVFIAALDTSLEVNAKSGQWQVCLALLSEMERLLQTHTESIEAFTLTRWKRYYPLAKLGKVTEAQEVLGECLQIYRAVGDARGQARTLFALSELSYENHQLSQAIALTQQALPLLEKIQEPRYAMHFHGNLRFYLTKAGEMEEAAKHTLAQLAYHLVIQSWLEVKGDLLNLTDLVHKISQTVPNYQIPGLQDLFNQPEFVDLQRVLQKTGGLSKLQSVMDEEVKSIMSR